MLELPLGAKIHPTFHVSQLKRKIGARKVLQTVLLEWEEVVEEKLPKLVLERKLVKKGNRPAAMVLVRWKNGSPEDATWELKGGVGAKKFPQFQP